jgi:citrate lyase subunit beta/citryl-CoA lyase
MSQVYRTMLFVPANRPAMLEKAPTRGADALLLDLEDAVPLPEKAAARRQLQQSIPPLAASGTPVYVRVNHPTTGETLRDLEAVVGADIRGVMIPKAEPDYVAQLEQWLSGVEQTVGLGDGRLEIIPLIESARGVELAYQVATASRRVVGLAVGAGEYGDLAVSLGAGWSESEVEFVYARSRTINAARAAGLGIVIDGVWTNVDDLDGLRRSAPRSKSMGFSGKFAIHPAQVPVINAAFSPTEAEVRRARLVLEAFEAAQAAGRGTSRADGLMVDYAMAAMARQVIALAERFGSPAGS